MIIDFTITNFRSIRDELTLSLFVDNPGSHLPENIAYPCGPRLGVLKTAGLYGANASGKSNVLLAIEALQWIIHVSGSLKEGEQIACYEPFLLSEKSKKSAVRFEVEFVAPDGVRYGYRVAFTQERILEEQLSYYPSAKSAVLFDRATDDTWETIRFGGLFTGGKKRLPFFPNNAYLSKAGNSADAPELVRNVYNYFRNHVLRLGLNEEAHFDRWIDDKVMFDKVSSLLSFVDAGVNGVAVREKDIDAKSIRFPDATPTHVQQAILRQMKREFLFMHLSDTKKTELFELGLESSGTRRLFKLAPLIVDALETGGVLIVDELDSSMHPFMAEMIIRLFNDPEVNVGSAQLLFSTHNISLMAPEHFRRDQVWFTEKIGGATTLYSLGDFDKKKVKPESPFNRWYAEGRFGAVPKIDYRGIVQKLKHYEGGDA